MHFPSLVPIASDQLGFKMVIRAEELGTGSAAGRHLKNDFLNPVLLPVPWFPTWCFAWGGALGRIGGAMETELQPTAVANTHGPFRFHRGISPSLWRNLRLIPIVSVS